MTAAPYRPLRRGTAGARPRTSAAAAVVIPSRDVFADPPALAVREDVLAAGRRPRAGAGRRARRPRRPDRGRRARGRGARHRRSAPRRATPAALHREGSGRFWLFRRHPRPLPAAAAAGRRPRAPPAARGRARCTPTASRAVPGPTAARRGREVVGADEVELERGAEAHDQRLHRLRHRPLVGLDQQLAPRRLALVERGQLTAGAALLHPHEALRAAQVDHHLATRSGARAQRLQQRRPAAGAQAHGGHGARP